MRAVVQRVSWARCLVEGVVVGECGPGFLVYAGAGKESTAADVAKLADRIAGMRVLSDSTGKMNLGLGDFASPDAKLLVVSNFTLYGDAATSRRPSFVRAAGFEDGERLFGLLVSELERLAGPVATGVFGAHMEVESLADGPVTMILGG